MNTRPEYSEYPVLRRPTLWAYAGLTDGPVGLRPRAPRLGGPRTWKMLLNKREKEEVGREKKGKMAKGRKRREKEKGKVKEIVFRTNKLTERFPCWSMEKF